MRRVISSDDIEVVGEAANGLEAIAFVTSNEVDVLVTDLRMPVVDGISMSAFLTERYPELIIVGFTGDADGNAELRAAGAAAVFEKPDADGLRAHLALIASSLRMSHARRPTRDSPV